MVSMTSARGWIALALVGASASTASAERPPVQAGAGLGALSFRGTYQGTFTSVMATGYGAVRVNRWASVGLRLAWFHGGETDEAALVPRYETTYLPVLLTARADSTYLWAELGLGSSVQWIVLGDGTTARSSSSQATALTVGVTPGDPTAALQPELSVSYVALAPVFERDVWAMWIAGGVRWR